MSSTSGSSTVRGAYGTRRDSYPGDGVEWFDSGAEPPEAVTAIEEMGSFIRRQVR